MGEPQNKEPDVVCNKDMLIEIVDIYENQHQAERLLSDFYYHKKRKPQRQLPNTLETLSKEIEKKLNKLNKGNYDGLGKQKKIVLLCGLMDPFINDIRVKYIAEGYKQISVNRGHGRYFDEIWVIWESEDKTKYNIFRLE